MASTAMPTYVLNPDLKALSSMLQAMRSTVDGKIAKDEDYYSVDVVFLVEDRLFRVPRAPFEQNSEVFRDMFQLPVPDGKVPDGSSDEQPLCLEGVKKRDFRLLLKVLVPRFSERAQTTASEWFPVLKLSLMWQMDKVAGLAIDNIISLSTSNDHWIYALKYSTQLLVVKIRDTAIEKLQAQAGPYSRPHLSSMDKILLGRECCVADWVLDGYKEMAEAKQALTMADEGRLGVDSTLKLYRVRDQYHCHGVGYMIDAFNTDYVVRKFFATELKEAGYTNGTYVSVRPRA